MNEELRDEEGSGELIVPEKSQIEVVHNIYSGGVIIDIVRRWDQYAQREYYDYRTSRKGRFTQEGNDRTAYCRKYDIQNNVRALMDAQDWFFYNRR